MRQYLFHYVTDKGSKRVDNCLRPFTGNVNAKSRLNPLISPPSPSHFINVSSPPTPPPTPQTQHPLQPIIHCNTHRKSPSLRLALSKVLLYVPPSTSLPRHRKITTMLSAHPLPWRRNRIHRNKNPNQRLRNSLETMWITPRPGRNRMFRRKHDLQRVDKRVHFTGTRDSRSQRQGKFSKNLRKCNMDETIT
jgi:hypothetical protein